VSLFKITIDMDEEILPAVLLPNMVGVETEFNASNLEEALLQRADLEDPADYLLGGTGSPRSGDDWMLKMASVVFSTSSSIKFAAERAFGAALAKRMANRRMLAVTLYNAATTVTQVDSGLSNEAACWAINAAATYGPALGLRFICSSFSTSISQTNLADTSMVLFKASEIFSTVYSMRCLVQFSLAQTKLCPFRHIFSKNPFPDSFQVNPELYPFFKDFDKSYKSRNGLDEEIGIVRHTMSLYTQNLHRMMKVAFKDDVSRSALLRVLFNILHDNKEEGNTASAIRDPMGKLSIKFAQSLSITSLLLQAVKGFGKKGLDELAISPIWCFADQMRFDLFSNQTTLQPVESRKLRAGAPNVQEHIFDDKSASYGTLFWLLHWSMRQSLHPVISQFNFQMQHLMRQLQNRLTTAEDNGNAREAQMAKLQLHYLNNKVYTLNAILMEPDFKFACLAFFRLSMKFMINVAEKSPDSLMEMPEFLLENINDVMGQLSRFENDFLADAVDEDFLHTAYKYIVLYMKGPTYAFNPHLRKDLGPLLTICTPFDRRREGDGNRAGSVLTMIGQLRHSAIRNFEDKYGLAKAVIGVFCDCELVTDDEGFDSKFSYRMPFYTVLDGLWKIEEYKKEIVKLSAEALEDMAKQPLFLRFISLLIDDTNSMMGKSMETFQEIRTTELKEEPTDEDKEKLDKLYRQAYSYVGLSQETLNLFGLLSKGCQPLFADPTLVTRIAEMANFFTNMLVGKNRKMLKVKDPKKINFRPIDMVKSLALLYVNMADFENWNKAVCADERAFSMGMIEEGGKILLNSRLPSAEVVGAKFNELTLILQDYIDEEIDFEEEPPDEFCDPIMGSLMEDPVELPRSGAILCRNTIARQLLVTPIDPFNRQPLSLDEVIPRPDLKVQIKQWKREQREKYSKNSAESSRPRAELEDAPMD